MGPWPCVRSAILQLQTWYMNKCFKSSQPLTGSGLYATLLGFGHNKIVVAVFSLCYNNHNKYVNSVLKNKSNLDMTCFLCPECPGPGSDGKCCFWESGKMYFVCLVYKGEESITTKKKKVRSGSFMSSCQQEGQHTKNLEKIKQTDFILWSTRQKISYTELKWKALTTMQWSLFNLSPSCTVDIEN